MLAAPKELFVQEWVELYNPGVAPVDLTGWLLDDAVEGGGKSLGESFIDGGSLLVVELGRPILNNSGDTVRLIGPDGGLVDALSFTGSAGDRAISRDLATEELALDVDPSPGELYQVPARQEPTPERVLVQTVTADEAMSIPEVAAAVILGRAEVPTTQGSPRVGPAAGNAAEPYLLTTVAPLPPATAVPAPDPLPPVEQVPPAPPVWQPLAGLVLVSAACAMVVADRKPRHPGGPQDGVL